MCSPEAALPLPNRLNILTLRVREERTLLPVGSSLKLRGTQKLETVLYLRLLSVPSL